MDRTELRAYNAQGEQLFITPDADGPQFETFDTVGAAFDRMEALKSAWRWDRERAGYVAADGFVRNRIAYFRLGDEHWTREAVAAHAQKRAARKAQQQEERPAVEITRKPTPAMVELLRKGAADPKGRMTMVDHNDRTQDGILRRDMADTADAGPWLSYLVINDRGRAYLAKLDREQQGERIARDVFQVSEGDVKRMGRAIADAAKGAQQEKERPAVWAVPGVRARCLAGKGKITDRFVHADGVERVTFVPDGARHGDALPVDVRAPHLEPLCIRCDAVGDDSLPHRETESGHLCGYCAAVLEEERQGGGVDTLREFSREVADADGMAAATVRVNRVERGARLVVGGARVLGWDNAYWRVAWVAEEGGRVVVCFWSASSNLEAAEEPVSAPVAAEEPQEGQQYGGVTREDVASGNGPAEALWRAQQYFRMFDARRGRVPSVEASQGGVERLAAPRVAVEPQEGRGAAQGGVWALVGCNRSGERVEALRPVVDRAMSEAGEVAVWSASVTTAAGVERAGGDVIAAEAVAVFVAQALSTGQTVHRHARGALRVTLTDGTMITVRPAGDRVA
jgi:hypothetical protein